MAPPVTYPPFEPQQEVRLAVVMYGGVSLAIYIHGVARELLSLVRATAPESPFRPSQDSPEVGGEGRRALLSGDDGTPPGRRLRGAESVYRKLGQMLSPTAASRPNGDLAADDPIRTRFVVDILSGTSAGGINGVFLAKALAANRPMSALKDLWVGEGDLGKLINDEISYTDEAADLSRQEPPASLLNSRRMFCKLLSALGRMDEGAAPPPTPFVDELDLFVTTTDIEGLEVRIPLLGSAATERRHKNVFRFKYSSGLDGDSINDFGPENNPFLAFAARATSSFPFAFEPMCLADVDEARDLRSFKDSAYRPEPSGHPGWRAFYRDYVRPEGGLSRQQRKESEDALADQFRHRAFGDGGYLDNKPFTHAIGALKQRRSDFPVDRKLVYIEPAPERPGDSPRDKGKPDALDNVLAALLVLPRYETIREDIEQVREINRMVDRVRVMLGGREADARHWGKIKERKSTAQINVGKIWRDEDLGDMLRRYGLAYGTYHRLKVAVVTDELALLVSTLLGLHEESEERVAIRYLIGAWRSASYTIYHAADGPQRPSENSFLFELDLGWRFRRLSFLRSRVDDLYGLEDDEVAKSLGSIDELAGIRGRLAKLEKGGREELRSALLMIKWGLNHAHLELRKAAARMRSPGPDSSFARALNALPIGPSQLWEIVTPTSDSARREVAARLVADKELRAALDAVADELRREMAAAMRSAARTCQAILGELRSDAGAELDPEVTSLVGHLRSRCPKGGRLAQAVMAHFFRYFEEYDLISFPILYQTGVGEADPVEVIRISPEDADLLFDERNRLRRASAQERAEGSADRLPAGQGRPKLAGTLLGNFGAFLAPQWRVNDMLWGRLDAAERLISALLPEDRRLRAELVEEAQVAILAEELAQDHNRELAQLLAGTLHGAATEGSRDDLARWLRDMVGEIRSEQIERLLVSCLDRDRLGAFFVESSQDHREPPVQATLASAARATEVIGKMLESLAAQRPEIAPSHRWLRLVTWLGRFFWGLVELAVPRSAKNLLARHWLRLLYGFELFAIAAGTLLGREGVAAFGWTAFGITFGINLLLYVLNSLMRGRKGVLRTLVTAAVALVLAAAGLGGVYAARHLGDDLRLACRNVFGSPAWCGDPRPQPATVEATRPTPP